MRTLKNVLKYEQVYFNDVKLPGYYLNHVFNLPFLYSHIQGELSFKNLKKNEDFRN